MKLSRRKLADHAATRLLAGDQVTSVMRELAAYLVEQRRTRETELVLRDIEARLLTGGTALVTVTSARPLTDETRQSVEQLVRDEQPHVRRVIMRETVDESVIGGVKIAMPGRLADFTVKAKLDKLTV